MRRTALVMILLTVLGGAAACGGDSDGADTASPPSSPNDVRASEFTEADVLIARYCLKVPEDGIERAEADAALDKLIGIAKEYPDEEFIPAVSYGEALTNSAVDPRACDAALARKLDQAVAELN
jgi:hypothetical protein